MAKTIPPTSSFKLNQWLGIQALARLAGSSPPKAKKAMLLLGWCDAGGIPTTQSIAQNLAIHCPNLKDPDGPWRGDALGFYQWSAKILPALLTQCASDPALLCKTKAVGGRLSAVSRAYEAIEAAAGAANQCGSPCKVQGIHVCWPHSENIILGSPPAIKIIGMSSKEACPKRIHHNLWDQSGRDAPKLLLFADSRPTALFAIEQGSAYCERLRPLANSMSRLPSIIQARSELHILTRWAKQYDFTRPAKSYAVERIRYILRQYPD